MIIFVFFIVRILVILCLIGFIVLLFKTSNFKEACRIIKRGFISGLYGTGLFLPKKHNKVERYQWIPDDSLEICENSERFAQLPAMDLADWMKHGYPKSPDSNNSCTIDCDCKLVCIKIPAQKI